ncbi:FAD-dependent monooxygenase [Cryptosporangium aurantiacum]|uniref:2-polyprenyl-6-methoxyphenol hydroxylase n=1 Tax=Cryptosporangium aurantiacum TaxID=134849 RepID=A0A1M7RP88_9ACTN|nr:FAD-dependent monooxygenase [Cryptosporangium aurantiacum]SHN47912.1 2-polyprenyl-6-methoxyphenol hydroxylase [Cryptosporangium aurantiacum]
MAAVRKVLIQGAGIGGLTLAAALGQRGVQVDVAEAVGSDAVLGVGLNQPANVLAALDEIGVREACLNIGFPFEELVLWNPLGEQVAAIPPPDGVYAKPSNNAIGRPAYNQILREAADKAGARIRTGVTIWEMHEDADGVEVELATWTGKRTPPIRDAGAGSNRYDLVVGFDGVRSKIREHLFGDKYAPAFTGSANWRVTLPRPDYLEHIVVAFAAGVKVVLTPTSRDDMYFGLVTPEPGKPRHAPEDFLDLFRERTRPFSGRLGELRDSITPDHTIVYTPLEYLTVREPWFRDRIAIAGDAAHTSPPHLSQGAAMAVEDAVTLAAALDQHDGLPDALDAWYRRRRDRALFVADASLALLKQENGDELTAADHELLRQVVPNAQVRLFTEAY